jgi:hypothetical protein
LARAGCDCATVAASAPPATKPAAAPIPSTSRARLSAKKFPVKAQTASAATQATVPPRIAAAQPTRWISRDAISAPTR